MLTTTETASTNAANTKQLRRGQPIAGGVDVKRLPRLDCWNCGKPIAYGVVSVSAGCEPLVIQCTRAECRAYNEFRA